MEFNNKKVWVFHHYATPSTMSGLTRPYDFGKEMIKREYDYKVFASAFLHYTNENLINDRRLFLEHNETEVPFVFVRTSEYKGNGLSRITNMCSFALNLYRTAKQFSKKEGKPDVIIASSPHPLTMLTGLFLAKKYKIQCICEVRDLWPESLVAYKMLKGDSLPAKLLYQGEKWIYKKADKIIMTWEGGTQYIKDKKWDNKIDLGKIEYISNGVAIKDFDEHQKSKQLMDADLLDESSFKVIYTGSVRMVNNLSLIVDVAKLIQERELNEIQFLIYGTGNEVERLKERCNDERIRNIKFKGLVEKAKVPFVLSKADINLLHNSSSILDRYGQSQNKLFEYLAAGKCVLQTYTNNYSIIEKKQAGICVEEQTAVKIADSITTLFQNKKACEDMGLNARRASVDYDFESLTSKLIRFINK